MVGYWVDVQVDDVWWFGYGVYWFVFEGEVYVFDLDWQCDGIVVFVVIQGFWLVEVDLDVGYVVGVVVGELVIFGIVGGVGFVGQVGVFQCQGVMFGIVFDYVLQYVGYDIGGMGIDDLFGWGWFEGGLGFGGDLLGFD